MLNPTDDSVGYCKQFALLCVAGISIPASHHPHSTGQQVSVGARSVLSLLQENGSFTDHLVLSGINVAFLCVLGMILCNDKNYCSSCLTLCVVKNGSSRRAKTEEFTSSVRCTRSLCVVRTVGSGLQSFSCSCGCGSSVSSQTVLSELRFTSNYL